MNEEIIEKTSRWNAIAIGGALIAIGAIILLIWLALSRNGDSHNLPSPTPSAAPSPESPGGASSGAAVLGGPSTPSGQTNGSTGVSGGQSQGPQGVPGVAGPPGPSGNSQNSAVTICTQLTGCVLH